MELAIYEWINDRRCNKPNRYDLHNQHGDIICHVIGCRRHTKLKCQFRGWFCPDHLKMISYIRSHIHIADENEIYWRHLEIYLRKVLDPKHVHYVRMLKTQ